jgi:hypothetical protein
MDDGTKVVRLANPKTLEYQVVRTSLLPGLLKTVRENKAHPLPLKVFETSDVVIKDPDAERQARNIRHAAALWCNKTAGFEVVHGLLDRIMAVLEVPRIQTTGTKAQTGYYLKETDGKLPACGVEYIDLMVCTHSYSSHLPSDSGRTQPRSRRYVLPRACGKDYVSATSRHHDKQCHRGLSTRRSRDSPPECPRQL